MGERQLNEAIANLVAMPLIILIGLYITASAIDPLLHINSQMFRIVFTVAWSIPSLVLFFKKKYLQSSKPRLIEPPVQEEDKI